ncbi:MAG: prepilin-type N-terminal cleavage/methylation domain-containing protein [Marinicellaceae bacterium]
MKQHQKQNGFTLLEILVAFTLLAAMFATIMEIIAGSAKNTLKASQNTQIAMLAQSKMDELGLFEVLEEGTTNGEFNENTTWVLEIFPFDVPYEGDVNQDFSVVELMQVKLTITTGKNNRETTTEFNTLRAITPDFTQPR